MRLLFYANGARYKASGGEWVFRKWVTVPSKGVQKDLGVSQHTMYKHRDELVKAGYIRFKSGDGSSGTEYMLCLLTDAQKNQPKPTEAYRSLPKPTKEEAHPQGSFNTDDFFEAAVRRSFEGDL